MSTEHAYLEKLHTFQGKLYPIVKGNYRNKNSSLSLFSIPEIPVDLENIDLKKEKRRHYTHYH